MATDTKKDFHDYKNESRKNWGASVDQGTKFLPSDMQIVVGCLMRIADSMEQLTKKVEEVTTGSEKVLKQNKNLRTYNKRLKKQLDELQRQQR
jgi:cell shape-determining protein MreC